MIGYSNKARINKHCCITWTSCLDLTIEETRRRLNRSVTEWDQFFAELEASWGYLFPDVKTKLQGPKDKTDKTKLRRVASGISTDATMSCTYTRKLKQNSFNRTKRSCSVEATCEKKSLTQSSKVTDEERRILGVSSKTNSKSNRTTASSKSKSAKRILLLEMEAMKKQDEIDEQLAAATRKAKIQKKQEEMPMRILADELETAQLEEESARTKHVANQEIKLARNGIQ